MSYPPTTTTTGEGRKKEKRRRKQNPHKKIRKEGNKGWNGNRCYFLFIDAE